MRPGVASAFAPIGGPGEGEVKGESGMGPVELKWNKGGQGGGVGAAVGIAKGIRQDHFSTPNPQVCLFYFLNLDHSGGP